MKGTNRKDIFIGCEVEVIQKHHQRTGELTFGFVKRILTIIIMLHYKKMLTAK